MCPILPPVLSVNAEVLIEDVRKKGGRAIPSSSDEVVANAEVAGGLEGWRACLSTPGGPHNMHQILPELWDSTEVDKDKIWTPCASHQE